MPYPYMVGNSRWGSYHKPFDYSVGIFASGDPFVMAENSGTFFDGDRSLFLIRSFGQDLTVSYPDGRIFFAGTDCTPPFALCLPVINHLARADGTPLAGRLISYRELENGHVFYPAFHREAISRLSRWVAGKSPELLARAAMDLGGEITGGADFACSINFLPRFPLTLKLWFPDEEMEGSANILFDSTANHYLHTEDTAAVGELAVRFLISHYQWLVNNNG
ncbi:MAG: DUF3786 domain-containing protein [Peptococcaceae bacterium]|nr:DUF3786 domain-containing protein [Peptococcaceae bacterium]